MGCLSPWGACLILNNAFLVFLEMAPEGSLSVGRFLNNIALRYPILRSIFEPNRLKNDKVMAFLVFYSIL